MGTYLVTGILQNICLRKKDVHEKIAIDNISTKLQKDVDLNNYIFHEDEHNIYWTLKPPLLEGNFPEFLEKQFNLYQLGSAYCSEILTALKGRPSAEERIKLSESKTFEHFQMDKDILESLKVKGEDGWERHISINYHLIAFFIDGKIIMECYGNILRYLEQNVRLNNQEYPVAQCLKIMMTS